MNVHTLSKHHPYSHSALKPINWLRHGFTDILLNPMASLGHGLAVTALIFVTLLMTSAHVYIIAAAVSGFMLIGPIMAAGLCELSRSHDNGESTNFDKSLASLKQNQRALTHFALILLSISVVWLLLSALILSLTIGNVAPPITQSLWGDFTSMITPSQLLLYLLAGGILAIGVFSISVVSVPAIIDKNLNAVDAIVLSFDVTMSHLPFMLVWAGLLVSLTAFGFLSFLVTMIVIYPLLGHATWHAYRDLVNTKT
jgi:uncharacterized membrane protein